MVRYLAIFTLGAIFSFNGAIIGLILVSPLKVKIPY